jgi:hypothetical protein
VMDPLCLYQLFRKERKWDFICFQLGYTQWGGERENVMKYLRGCAGGWAQSGRVCVEFCA